MTNENDKKNLYSRAVKTALEDAARVFVKVWPLQNFVACSPLIDYEHLAFDSALEVSKRELGWVDRLAEKDFRRWYAQGAMTLQRVEEQFERCAPSTWNTCFSLGNRDIRLKDILRADLIAALTVPETLNPDIRLKTLLETVDYTAAPERETNLAQQPITTRIQGVDWLTGESLSQQLDEHTVKWLSAFLDKGQAMWPMPNRHLGLRVAWQNLVLWDNSLSRESRRVLKRLLETLPENHYDALGVLLETLEVPAEDIKSYLRWHFAQLPGWIGYIRWHVEQMDQLHGSRKPYRALLADYLILRLSTELALCEAFVKKGSHGHATLAEIRNRAKNAPRKPDLKNVFENAEDRLCRLRRIRHELSLSVEQMETLLQNNGKEILSALDTFDQSMKSKIYRESMETTYQNHLLGELKQNLADPGISATKNPPVMHAVFCIDNRSEPLRLALEACGTIKTLGFAGFFGVPTRLRSYAENFSKDLCPVLITPRYAIAETPLDTKMKEATCYLKKRQRFVFLKSMVRCLMKNAAGMFTYVEAFGLAHTVLLLMKTFFHQHLRYPAFHEVRPELVSKNATPRRDGLVEGITMEEQTYYAEAALTMIGLTDHFSPIVLFCGHGSQTENNPYHSSLDCGACSGHAGGASARILSEVLNDTAVRDSLVARGIIIPEETVFLAAEHNTVTDEVTFLNLNQYRDRISVPLEPLLSAFKQASKLNRNRRTTILPAMMKHAIRMNATDWSQVRPEWGAAGNAAMIVGPRSLTEKCDLKGRVFLHSYDSHSDIQGKSLEDILTGALIVAHWINAQYLFSTLDNRRFGSGSKTIHNVVGRFGVMRGNASDLQVGLPLQTLMIDHEIPYHMPLRLTAMVCAPWQTVDRIIRRHKLLQNLFNHQWIYLIVFDIESRNFLTYLPEGTWKVWQDSLPLQNDLEILEIY